MSRYYTAHLLFEAALNDAGLQQNRIDGRVWRGIDHDDAVYYSENGDVLSDPWLGESLNPNLTSFHALFVSYDPVYAAEYADWTATEGASETLDGRLASLYEYKLAPQNTLDLDTKHPELDKTGVEIAHDFLQSAG